MARADQMRESDRRWEQRAEGQIMQGLEGIGKGLRGLWPGWKGLIYVLKVWLIVAGKRLDYVGTEKASKEIS